MIERRKFSRIIYQADVTLIQKEQHYCGSLIDLSLHGLLIELNDNYTFNMSDTLVTHFTLNNSNINIMTECEIIDHTNNMLRLCISRIDIDSISHLKRLVELNVGNSTLLLRQLSELTETH